MRVLFVNPSGKQGGAETVMLELIGALRETVPAMTIGLISGEEGPVVERVRSLGVWTEVAPFPADIARFGDSGLQGGHRIFSSIELLRRTTVMVSVQRYARQLRRSIERFRPDIIHSNGFKMHLLCALAKPPGTHLLWHIHDFVGSRPLMSRLLRFSARRASVAVANSQSVGRDLKKVFGDGLAVRPICNGVDIERFASASPLDLDSLSGLSPSPGGTFRVGLVATFARWKGHHVFLRALAELKHLPLRGYIAGAPLYQTAGSQYSLDELRQAARSLGLEERIGFTGFVKDVPALMHSLDIVVHASTSPEPFGMVIAEAMAAGRPVVSSAAGGAGEIVRSEATGLVHEPGNHIELASQLRRLIAEPHLRDRLAKAGQQYTALHLNRTAMTAKFLDVYRGLSGSGAPARVA